MPILENQLPQRLPLDARAEVSTRADAMSIAYRRWLKARRFNYGVEVAVGDEATSSSQVRS
jgi:phenylpropionate dioxygenase-like ring-hydroxylating dioxygenase large terminal subunit